MLICAPTICWQHHTLHSIYSQSSQLPVRLAQRMALWNNSHLQATRSHTNIGSVCFSVKNLNSSYVQNTSTCSVSFGRRLQSRLSTRGKIHNVKFGIPSHWKPSGISWELGSMQRNIGSTASGLSLVVSGMANAAEGPMDNNTDVNRPTEASASSTHGKKIYTDYTVTGIPGDGRCLFRSVAHGVCVRSGKPIPDEDLQRKLADELRTMVADEFIKRRTETEWFIEGDFDTYVSAIRKPHVWGGEPELLMASHVLQMPITVYMHDDKARGLIAIAEYGQEYGTEAPILVLYHGFGHYDALNIPGRGGPRSRL